MSCCISVALRTFCFCFVPAFFAFIKDAALCLIVSRYARSPAATRSYLIAVSIFFCFDYFLFLVRCRFFRVFFVPLTFFFVGRTRCTFSFGMAFLYLVTTSLILILAYERIQSIHCLSRTFNYYYCTTAFWLYIVSAEWCTGISSYIFPFRMVLFNLVTMSWILTSAYVCENSTKQSINHGIPLRQFQNRYLPRNLALLYSAAQSTVRFRQ